MISTYLIKLGKGLHTFLGPIHDALRYNDGQTFPSSTVTYLASNGDSVSELNTDGQAGNTVHLYTGGTFLVMLLVLLLACNPFKKRRKYSTRKRTYKRRKTTRRRTYKRKKR